MLQLFFFFLKQKTAYDMRISDWSSDVCSSDLKGGRDLQLRIIGTARALPRIGPAVVEDIFALAVRLQISGRRRDQCARSILDQQRRRLPAGARPDATRFFESRQKIVSHEGVGAARQRVPCRRLDRGDAVDRKSVVSGKRVSVRVDLGVRATSKKQQNIS